MSNYHDLSPKEVRQLIRDEKINSPTSGMCGGYAQANLVILPKKYSDDFKLFAEYNPKPCPILEITEPGSCITKRTAGNANIVTDIPKYFIYKNGVKVDEVTNAEKYFGDDFVCFLIGCSFSFDTGRNRCKAHNHGLQCSHVQNKHSLQNSRNI